MRMGRKVGIFLIVIAAIFLALSVKNICASGDEKKAGENQGKAIESAHELDVILISNDDYEKDRKGPVAFSHQKHGKDYHITCWDCHHEYDEGINTWSPWGETYKCSECHDPDEKIDNVMKLQTAFHVNCKNCHKELHKEKKKTGPFRKCLGCHQK